MTTSRSATRPLVLASIENADGTRCVDLFRRADGTFGFEAYRRDPEDPRGWGGPAGYGDRVFADENAAREAAFGAVAWLSQEGS